jgi:dihydroorotase-like cyclic amidohydrolase
VIDYAFHMILADPSELTLKTHLPKLVKEGHSSIKIFMTYDRIKLDDEQMLDVLAAARDNDALVCVHAENHGMISFMSKRLLANGMTAPSAFWMSHPRISRDQSHAGHKCRMPRPASAAGKPFRFTSGPCGRGALTSEGVDRSGVEFGSQR